jgi:hypothetical protein
VRLHLDHSGRSPTSPPPVVVVPSLVIIIVLILLVLVLHHDRALFPVAIVVPYLEMVVIASGPFILF